MKKTLFATALVLSSIQLNSIKAEPLSPLARLLGCGFLVTFGAYSMIKSNMNYDNTQGAIGLANKGIEKGVNLANKVQHKFDDTEQTDEERLYIKYNYWEKFPVRAALWAGLGLASFVASWQLYNYQDQP